jgi:hypothetical protein
LVGHRVFGAAGFALVGVLADVDLELAFIGGVILWIAATCPTFLFTL